MSGINKMNNPIVKSWVKRVKTLTIIFVLYSHFYWTITIFDVLLFCPYILYIYIRLKTIWMFFSDITEYIPLLTSLIHFLTYPKTVVENANCPNIMPRSSKTRFWAKNHPFRPIFFTPLVNLINFNTYLVMNPDIM